ncbi:MAG TPA: hypothetical protein VFW51_04860 [Actinomycetota bacterium]|nr:hypothetical protein [Actinomycetota bacterium]
MKTRRLWRVLGGAALAVLLAGCFKVNMDLDVTADNTVSGTAVVAVEESLLELSGQNVDQLFADMDLSDLPPGSNTEPYEEDGFVGRQITFEEVPLSEFTGNGTLSGTASGEELNIVRDGDEFHVTGGFDMSGQEFTGTEIPQQFLENFEFRISITFPGPVSSASGDIDGNTVTWEPRVGQNTEIQAVASAIPSSSSPLLMIVLIAAGALVLGAIVYFLTHRGAAAAADPIVGTGFGDAVPAPAPARPEGSPIDTPRTAFPAPDDDTPPPPPPPSGI